MLNNKIYIGTRASIIDDDGILWMSEYYFNGLVKMDINTGEIIYVTEFPRESFEKKELHIGAVCFDSNIVFTPYVGTKIHIFNKKSRNFEVVCAPEEYGLWYSKPICIGNNVFLISECGYIIRFNIPSKNLMVMEKISRVFKTFLKEEGNVGRYVDQTRLIAQSGRRCLIIDIENETAQMLDVSCNEAIEYLIGVDGEKLFFTLMSSTSILDYDLNTNETIRRCADIPWGKKFNCNAYGRIFRVDNELIAINYNAMHLMKTEDNDKEFRIMDSDFSSKDIIFEKTWGPIFEDVHFYNGKAYIIPCSSRWLYIYDISKQTIEKNELYIGGLPDSRKNKIVDANMEGIKVISEDDPILTLSNYLGFVLRRENAGN